jgi:hypothetical protein
MYALNHLSRRARRADVSLFLRSIATFGLLGAMVASRQLSVVQEGAEQVQAAGERAGV